MTFLNVRLAADEAAAVVTGEDGQRSFSGIANSGTPFWLWGEQYVVDFARLSHKDKVPVLVEHDRLRRAGSCQLTAASDGLRADGLLLANEYGNAVAEDSDGGFPWEMSVDLRAERREFIDTGTAATVNGAEYTGPMWILRDCTIREVSFCALGQDPNTSAVALSENGTALADKPDFLNHYEGEDMNPTQADIDKLNAEKAQLAAEKQTLLAQVAKAETDALLAQNGFAFAEGKPQGLSDATYRILMAAAADERATLLADLKPQAPAQPAAKPEVPAALLGDNGASHQPEQTVSALLADAKARAERGKRK
ncbi:hypothetical protein J2T38_001695 [Neisseria perflava]|uniref:hypothetical protein n=1 Tax=Neisseria perflava TaxID=33053 RepID=UPI00209E8158|nr:hypothetical protein [Neisseria perflava]MCP1772859.1 hypothetical protein [Neisseria perflava]